MTEENNRKQNQPDESYIIYNEDEQEEFGAGELFDGDEDVDGTGESSEVEGDKEDNSGSVEEQNGSLFDGEVTEQDGEAGLFDELDNEFGSENGSNSQEDEEDDQAEYEPPEIDGEVKTVSGPSRYDPIVYFQSSENMSQLEDDSVSLIVTSPPYNADWAYGSHDDQMDYQTEYLPMLARVFTECWRVLEPAGRMVVNVPTLLRGGASGGQAILSDIDTMLNEKVGMWTVPDRGDWSDIRTCMEKTGFVHREFGIWNKGFNDAGMAPNGSFPRPGGILLNNMHEGWSVYQKPGDRDYSEMSDERIEESKIQKWADDMCDDVWDISPEDRDLRYSEDEDVPPFPEEFVKRCVALWTYRDDLVVDPFLGSGTTCKVCKGMKRHSVGYELREEIAGSIKSYIGLGQQRLM